MEHFLAACIDCQHTMYETKSDAGLLCPLLVPCRPWENLSLECITGLPPFRGNTIILIVVDHFSKGIHLGMLPTNHTSFSVAVLFIDIVGKLHGMPRSLVLDRDPLFICRFWQELFRLSGTHLRMSSAYHPQTEGQTEVLNHVIEQCLCSFVHKKPTTWGKFLSWVKWSYNTPRHSGSGASPYEITFGKKPITFPQHITGTSNVDVVNDLLTNRNAIFTKVQRKLLKAQQVMKQYADSKRSDTHF